MNDAERGSKLVLRAEASLAAAPVREPDWDALAERIESALGSAGASDDALLLPPLPESLEDGREELTASSRERDTSERAKGPHSEPRGASLAELARAAVARRGSKDAVNLAKESLAIASQSRALPEPASRPAAVSAAPAVKAAVVELERRAVAPSPRPTATLDTRGPWIGVVIAAVGLAAGFGLYLASRQPPAPSPPAPIAVATAANNATATAAPAVALPSAALAAKPSAPEQAATEKEPAVAPRPANEPVPAETLARESAPVKTAPPAAEARTSGTPSPARPRAQKVVLEDAPATASAVSPAKPAQMRPAELNATSGGISDRPSTGAAQAAVGAVLGAARSCITGQPEASSATLVFGSSGEVTSVSVSGPAQGTPAAACIKAALGKARVQPFAAQTFTLGVTVRPL
jgi:hypothetical protein